MKTLAVAIAIAISGFSFGQQTARTDSIWVSAVLRMQRQNDVWFKFGDFPRVIQSLKFQAAILPKNYDIVTNLGWMLENEELYPEALAVYIKYRESNPTEPEAYYPEAMYYFQKKAYDKVPLLLEPSLKIGSGPTPNSYRILARAYEKLEMYRDAQRVWKLYLAKNPEDGQAKVNLQRVEKKLKGR